ncbi:Oidioi.mRNA.OKI2018_I69.chr2.g5265.t1.cds [Oikopleura dioica]|uniref:Oidioi.mRNA.OKI2018_I69.chr2.g5265.t1.cds n=1 Tax=Oikopleura dioica TaxID=34765 RepID=A0ABN7SZK1_OIKDI|nr:Oidioi.mRNA.OKI2018_I69.chr2.g5265.t1.cds [Oikopleura dioica]
MGRKLSLKNSVRIVKLGLTTLCTGNLHLLRRGVEDELDDDGSSSEEEDDGGSIEEEEDFLQYRDQLDDAEEGDDGAGTDDDDQVEAEEMMAMALIDGISINGSIYADELYDKAEERKEDDAANLGVNFIGQNDLDDDASLEFDFDLDLLAFQDSSSSSSEDDRSQKDDDDEDDHLFYDSH